METMQSILEKDKEKFLQLLNSEDDAERAAAQVNRELSRILYVFNEQANGDKKTDFSSALVDVTPNLGSGMTVNIAIAVLKGCVAWAKENGVTVITAEHMDIINDKRAKEKGGK